VVIWTGVTAAATVRVNDFVAVCAVGVVESVTLAVNENEPEADGVPEIVPVAANVKPAGKAPEATLQLYGVVPPLAASVVEYAVPTCPARIEVVVICTGVTAAAIVIVSDWLEACAVGVVESVTFAVKLKEPDAVGVPEIVPLADKPRPAGKAPEATLQLYGVVPPVAASVVEYAVPTCPAGIEVVVICTGVTAAATVIVKDFVVVWAVGVVETVAITVKLNEPAVVGVPEIVPAVDSASPPGNAPELRLHVYGVVPPLAPSVVEYATPTCPFANEVVVIASGVTATPVPETEIVLSARAKRLKRMLIVPEKDPLEVGPNTTWNTASWPGCKMSGKAGPETVNWEELLVTRAMVTLSSSVFVTVKACGELSEFTFIAPKLIEEGVVLTAERAWTFVPHRPRDIRNATEHTNPCDLVIEIIDTPAWHRLVGKGGPWVLSAVLRNYAQSQSKNIWRISLLATGTALVQGEYMFCFDSNASMKPAPKFSCNHPLPRDKRAKRNGLLDDGRDHDDRWVASSTPAHGTKSLRKSSRINVSCLGLSSRISLRPRGYPAFYLLGLNKSEGVIDRAVSTARKRFVTVYSSESVLNMCFHLRSSLSLWPRNSKSARPPLSHLCNSILQSAKN
jgi:hypothetical protein